MFFDSPFPSSLHQYWPCSSTESVHLWLVDRCSLFLLPVCALSLLISLNVIAFARNRCSRFHHLHHHHHSALRPGSFSPIFYLVVFSHFVLALLLPVLFLLLNFFHLRSVHAIPPSADHLPALSLASLFHLAFWSLCFCRFWSNRHLHEQPISLIFSYSIFSLLTILPLLFWSRVFVDGPRGANFVLYCVEFATANFVFFAVLCKSTLKKEGESAWQNFLDKCLQIWPYVWPKKSIRLQFYVFICLLLLALGRVINVLIPLYSKWIVDALSGPNPYFCYELILIATGLKFLQGSGGQGGFINTVRGFIWLPIQQYTTIEIEVNMLHHLHNLSLRWHLSRKTGEILRVMDKGTNSINTLLSYVLFSVIPAFLDIGLAAIFFFSNFNTYFGLLVLTTMVIYIAVTVAISEWRIQHRREMNECDKRAGAIGVDSLINYETIKHYNAEELETQRYKAAYLDYQKAEYRANASLSLLNLCQNSIIGVGLAGGSLLAAFLITRHGSELTAGDYVLFSTYLLQLYAPLNFFGTIYRLIQRSFIDMENMLALFKEEIEINDVPGAKELEQFPGCIEFHNVSFSYKPEKAVLQNLSFTVNPGETVALVGPSGSGKTTIVRLLFRLYDVTDGQISFNGTDIRQLKLKSVRERIGIVPQDTVLFNDTIRYNILYGRPGANQAEVEEAAKAAAIHQFITSQPEGYDCLVGERGLKLSGGEKQRVAIARVVLRGPEYILLDEATSALDSKTERSIQHNLFELCKRRTTVIVAHRLSTVVHADKILVLSGGTVVENGSHAQLLEMNGLYAEMWRLQNERTTTTTNPDDESSNDDK